MRFEFDGQDIDPPLPEDGPSMFDGWAEAVPGRYSLTPTASTSASPDEWDEWDPKWELPRHEEIVQERWPQFGAELTIDVLEHEQLGVRGLQGAVNFGAFKGTILFMRTEQDLEWCYRRMYFPQSAVNDDFNAWVAAGHLVAAEPPVRRLIYGIRWKAEMSMGRTTYCTTSSLTFSEDMCLAFKGRVRLPIGDGASDVEEIEFEGFKVKAYGVELPLPWESYWKGRRTI